MCLCSAVGKQFYIQEEKKMTRTFTRGEVEANFTGYSVEEIQEYINIATELVVDLLRLRGATSEELHAFRKQVIDSELAFIDAEIAKYGGTSEPILPFEN